MISFRTPILLSALLLAGAAAYAGGKEGHSHGHSHGSMRVVPEGAAAPTLALAAAPDTMSGYNLHLMTENFTFSPAKTGTETEAVEGHAHLYINDVKVGRVYSNWVHIPADWLGADMNAVRVTLNDNMHNDWAVGDKMVAAEIMLERT
ncbi:MAG: hypothetical protein AAFY59_18390, partial [Pseudomonadota bacterium]